MNNAPKNQQIEFEVFPKENKSSYAYLSGVPADPRTEPAQINVVFSHQSVIIVFICAIMLLIASFSLGVEKGKLVAKNTFSQEKSPAIPATAASAVSAGLTGTGTQKPQTAVALTAAASTAKEPAGTQKPGPAITNLEPAPTATATPAAAGGYTIQVASLKSASAARDLSETLAKKGISSFTRVSGDYTIVLAGNFSKKEEAQQGLKTLKKTYTDCYVRKI
jgi:hypothetical protein